MPSPMPEEEASVRDGRVSAIAMDLHVIPAPSARRLNGPNNPFHDAIEGARTLHVTNPSVFSKSSTHLPQTPMNTSRGPHTITTDASTDFLHPFRTRTRSATSTTDHASSYYAPSTIGSESIYNAPPLPPLNAPVYRGMIRQVQDPFTGLPQRPTPARSSSGSQDASIYILPSSARTSGNSSWDSAASLHRKPIPLPSTSSRASPATVIHRPSSSGSGSVSGNRAVPSTAGSGSSGSRSGEVDPNLLMPHPYPAHLSSTTVSSSVSSYLAYLDSSRPATMASQQSDPFHLDRPEYYWRDSGSDVPDVPPLNVNRR
ncbi:hypothetical protein K490DRAFT_55841 [Saccharata proteae CBS 121410]|uniref:Uncharacterized protein n=1 Tax=Saccharata proteae CBS 121410 TaxID=1314787 RepID=A0A9P4LY49_9PEZI|nr:hypothetical protein K490DRAFT_55841 [Saccharata proteae CBS 121410]